MSEGDKQVNRELAAKLFQNVMGGKPGRTLDIGAKLPVFAAALGDLGCKAWALEHEPVKHDLPVKTVCSDFELWDEANVWPKNAPQKFDFISLIHTFEHLYDPLKAIQKLRSLVTEEGAVYIRSPDHSVAGFERDLTDGHYAIHPFYHSLSSLLQCLYATRSFVIADSWILDGFGQRDIVLRPVQRPPTIALGMIVKNEERDLPRILKSVEKAVDSVSKGLACQPCFRETHPNSLHPRGPCINIAPSGVHSCMDAISVEEVLEAAKRVWATASAEQPAYSPSLQLPVRRSAP